METYEDYKRDPSLPQDVRAEWLSVDSAEQRYRAEGDRIAGDEDLTELARNRKLVDLHVNQGLPLAERKKALRQRVLQLKEQAERASWPRAKGMSLEPNDSSELIAAQNVEAAIVSDFRELQRKAVANKLPWDPDAADYLRERYKAGLDTGGVAGSAQIRGVLGAARRLGVDVEAVVGPLRSQREFEALERTQRFAVMSDVISTQVPLHRSVQRNRRKPSRINERRGWGAATILMPGSGEPEFKAPAHTHTGKPRSKSKGKKR